MTIATTLRYVKIDSGTWENRFYIMSDYRDMAKHFGINLLSVLSAEDADYFAEIADGLIIPGSGTDIDPSYYGKEPFDPPTPVDEYALDAALIDAFSRAGKPIFGICGGHQAINVFFGGTLKHLDDEVSHREGDRKLHRIKISHGSFVEKALGATEATVNCYHGLEIERLAEGFEAVARTDDGVIEAIECRARRIYATQWHPEHAFRAPEHPEVRLFENFFDECRKVSEAKLKR